MDILVFAAIAFFIFLRLKNQLGKIDEGDKNKIQEKLNKKRQLLESLQSQMLVKQNKPNPLQAANEAQEKLNEALTQSLDEESKHNFLKAIKACNVSAEFFLNGSKTAFEMVIKAFASNDLETLKFLLSDTIYAGFEQSVNQRAAEKHTLISNLISIQEANIISATVEKKIATVTIQFVSQQINYVTDKEGQMIEGSKEEIVELTDIWTFKKDVTISSPNWLIVSTNS